MRYIKDIEHTQLKISLFSWNSKYIVKIEAGPYEQTYKVAEFDVTGPEEVERMISDAFVASVLARFQQMDADWTAAMESYL
ncbi:hypothetical protein [Fibrella forsythiae]|uniref:Uncharacterized protein n=1 Tax=Fibrella forsythiae TaxID=2817061 RepID=A0ABS3JBJ6_9BACT|nr:hypothetical protein [Fibrella forsythiae]MBO0947365.1 hypothetical protein [Fibrella forsythiae]